MNDRVVHIIAPSRDIAQAYARRINKYPHRISEPVQLAGLIDVEIVVVEGDSKGDFSLTAQDVELLKAVLRQEDLGQIKLVRVRL